MSELQRGGVKERAPHPIVGSAVDPIAEHRVIDRCEMDPDLMGSSGLEIDGEARRIGKLLHDFVVGAGLSTTGPHRHAGG